MKRRIPLALLVMAGFALAAAPALAGKGGNGSRDSSGARSSSITLVMLNASLTESTSGPRLGDQVTFAVSTTATNRPWVNANCYQNGRLVYSQWRGFFDGYRSGQIFTLGPTPSWTSGDADCRADLVNRDNFRNRILASTTFHVEG